MDRLQLDLSLVKKEPTLDDYGHSSGNILDNIISESDFQDNFGHTGSSVPNSEADMDCGVDWLSSFFDEPPHENIHGFGPPLSELPTSVHCITSASLKLSSVDTSQHESKALLVDTLNSFPDDYSNDIIYKSPNSIRPPSPGFPGNPLLSQMDELQKSSSEQDLSVDPSRASPNLLLSDKISPHEPRLSDNTIGLSDHIGLSRPPPRILAATVISSETRNNLQNGNSRQTQSVLNTVLNTRIKGSDDMTESLICQTQKNQFHVNSNVVSELLSTGLLTGMIKKEQESRENDSGCNGSHLTRLSAHHDFANLRNSRTFCYESTSQSPLAPPSPQGVHGEQLESHQDSMSTSSAETPTGDTPQERAPFFLTEEERRTLIAEGLPIPAGLPLTKTMDGIHSIMQGLRDPEKLEERALKKVRRKIKNKISAQESRRKKKEYMEALEKKVEGFTADNTNLKKKTETLEAANRSLIIQVQKLQALLATKVTKSLTTRATQIP